MTRVEDLPPAMRAQAEARLAERAPTLLQRLVGRQRRALGEDLLARQLDRAAIPYERQVRLVEGSRLTWDFVVSRLAVEVQGGLHSGGAHVRAWGVDRDIRKANTAVHARYIPLFVTTEMVEAEEAVPVIVRALREWGWAFRMIERPLT